MSQLPKKYNEIEFYDNPYRSFSHLPEHYAAKDLQAIAAMFAEDIHLRDWNISVHGKEGDIRETAKNFAEAESREIHVLTASLGFTTSEVTP